MTAHHAGGVRSSPQKLPPADKRAIVKFLGAMCFGLLTMFTAAYWMARTANQRSEDFATVRSLSSHIFGSIKSYYRDLLHPASGVESAT